MNTTSPFNIFFSATESYAQHFTVAAISLLENNRDLRLRLFVIHSEPEICELEKAAVFLAETYKTEVSLVKIKNINLSVFNPIGYYGTSTFFRLFIGEIAPQNIDQGLFLDADLIVTGTLKELTLLDISDYDLAAVKETSIEDNLQRLSNLGIRLSSYFNAGVLLINLKRWRDLRYSEKFISIAEKYGKSLVWVDQDILNIQIADNWLDLNPKYNGIHLLEKKPIMPVIVHYNSASKPWHYVDTHPYNFLYWKYLALSPFKSYSASDLNLKNIILKHGRLFKRVASESQDNQITMRATEQVEVKRKYDYLIVGSGLFGCVFAHEATKRGKLCLVIDKREHPGGNVYCDQIEGINVHKYGAHIFHTNDKHIWDYVNSFVEFNRYTNSPVANYKGELFNLPFNMNTFYQLWKVTTPAQAQKMIRSQISQNGSITPANLEEQALALVGTDIYEKLIKGYTEKQWGRSATELPAFIIKRLPVRFTYDNNYFDDKYQGIPIGGYNKLIDGLLQGIEVKLEIDYFDQREFWEAQASKIVFTGNIDQYYGYQFGRLEYRSLRFEHTVYDQENLQGNAVINYTEREIPFTRTIEHKHFEFGKQPKTVVTKEFPEEWTPEKEAYYPINNIHNTEVYNHYKRLGEAEERVIFGGRLAEYKYYDMHQIIASALKKVSVHFNENIS